MFKKLILVCALVTLTTQLSATDITAQMAPTESIQEIKIENTDQLNAMMNKFLYRKDANEAKEIARYLSQGNALNRETRFPVAGFFMGIKNDNPQLFDELKQQSYSRDVEDTLVEAEKTAARVNEFLGQELTSHQETPEFLGTMWGYFYATGDTRVLDRMCEMEKRTLSQMFRLRIIYTYEANMGKFPDIIQPCP